MSVESLIVCHSRIHEKIKTKYNINYYLPRFYEQPNKVALHAFRSYSPGQNNATKTLRLLINMAKKHKVKIRLCAASRSYGPMPSTRDTFKEREYYYWRALLMYQSAGFKAINKQSFLVDIAKLYPVNLIAG